jgi:hypothetical protein
MEFTRVQWTLQDVEVFFVTQMVDGYNGIHKRLELVTPFMLNYGECIEECKWQEDRDTLILKWK